MKGRDWLKQAPAARVSQVNKWERKWKKKRDKGEGKKKKGEEEESSAKLQKSSRDE